VNTRVYDVQIRRSSMSRDITSVVLGWHYTNTPQTVKHQVTPIIDGCTIGLTASNAVLRTGESDR
jgi:hypothetical protein